MSVYLSFAPAKPMKVRQLKGKTMQNIKRRIVALEANASVEASNLTMVQIFPKDGETSEEAIRKAGHDPDAPDAITLLCGNEADLGTASPQTTQPNPLGFLLADFRG